MCENMFKYPDGIPKEVVDDDKKNFLLLDVIINNLKAIQEHPEDRILYLNKDFLGKFLVELVEKTAGFCYSHEKVEVGK